MSHNSTALAQLSAANARKTEENRSHINKIVAPHFTANLCVKIATRQRYVSGKPLLTHPFKLKQTADLCVRSGEVMVFLTRVPRCEVAGRSRDGVVRPLWQCGVCSPPEEQGDGV